MTSTLILLFRIAMLLLMAYTVYTFVRAARKKGYWLPKERKDWKDLFGDAFTLAAGVFVLFMLKNNYEAPIQSVMSAKDETVAGISYIDVSDRQTKRLSDLKGKVVLLNIWATWCPPCRREMPDLDKLEQEYGSKGFAVVALSDEDIETVSLFQKENQNKFSLGIFASMPASIAGIGTRPVSILIDTNGNVVDMVVGARGFNFFQGWVKKHLP
jgi:thiol-disulfide isomerase/thioredoxin